MAESTRLPRIWRPYTQMKTAAAPILIDRAEGAILHAADGRTFIDGIASWWVNLHGHAHPEIAQAIAQQAGRMEHVIFAGFSHQPAEELAQRLLAILNGQDHLFFSDNGSTAVEVGLKMAIQAQARRHPKRQRILALENAYHGDTFGAMSVSGRSLFTAPFNHQLFDVTHIPVPKPGHEQSALKALQRELEQDDVAAFIFEPLVQGTAGMVMHTAAALDELLSLCQQRQVITIADEVMTGFGRTGSLFACDQLRFTPDIMCFSKGLTGGALPLGATTCNRSIFSEFWSDRGSDAFFHGHSYCGNPLGCAAALASLDLLVQPQTLQSIANITANHAEFAATIAHHPAVSEVRHQGTILAVELAAQQQGYLSNIRDRLYQHCLAQGVLLRPLGNVLYTIPPYCVTSDQLRTIYGAMASAADLVMA